MIEELKKELSHKDDEIKFLKQKLEDKNTKDFDNQDVLNILQHLKPVVHEQKQELYKNSKEIKLNSKSFFQSYQESKFIDIAQSIKKIPILGKILLIIKHNILKWN